MNCIRCDCRAGYNRAVVDTVSGRELGRICRNCEFDEFGRSLDRSNATDRSCAMCDRDGHVALAPWTPRLEEAGDRLVSAVEYEVTEGTPVLCDEHFHAVADVEPERADSRRRVSR